MDKNQKISMNKLELLEKMLIVSNILSGKDYKVNFVNQRNGMYRIDVARHEDDFWLSDEYKECEKILGDNLIEGTYGSNIYTLWIKAGECGD